MIRLSAFRFFIENAGYCTPPGAGVCALALAKAEQWANDNGVEFRIEGDPDADKACLKSTAERVGLQASTFVRKVFRRS